MDKQSIKNFAERILFQGEYYTLLLFERSKYGGEKNYAIRHKVFKYESPEQFYYQCLEMAFPVCAGLIPEMTNPMINPLDGKCVLFVNFNPIDIKKANQNLLQETLNLEFENKLEDNNLIHKYHSILNTPQVSKRKFLDFDLDDPKRIDEFKDLLRTYDISQETIIQTKNGFHILVPTSNLPTGENAQKFFNSSIFHEKNQRIASNGEIFSDPICSRKPQLCPIPGTFQGDFIPKLYN